MRKPRNESSRRVSSDAVIEAQTKRIGSGTRIEKGSVIRAREVRIGHDVVIDRDCNFTGFGGGPMDKLVIGDDSYFGKSVHAALPVLVVGDYVTVHRNTSLFGLKPCLIGHNTWVGEGSILNSHEVLRIGNAVGIGTNSYIWTHVGNGELLEGCTLLGAKPVVIEDNAWLVGGNLTINPGLTIARKSVILTGSVVTRNTQPGHCYAGVPARDITHRIRPFADTSLTDKFEMMKDFVREYVAEKKAQGIKVVSHSNGYELKGMGTITFSPRADSNRLSPDKDRICVVMRATNTKSIGRGTLFVVDTKTYTKTRSAIERDFMRFLKGYRAKFVPSNAPHVTL